MLAPALAHRRATSPAPITVAMGDGIGPEIMAQPLRILEEAGAGFSLGQGE